MKNETTPAFPLPSNWKSIVLFNCQGVDSNNEDEPCYACEITKDSHGNFVEPVWVGGEFSFTGEGDWVASVTLVDGTIIGLEEVKVGEQLGFAIKSKIWV